MTDHIIKAAREARLGTVLCHNSVEGDRVWIEGADWHDELGRFHAIAFKQGMERAAEIAIDLVAFHGGSVEIEAAIRAHAQNQPKNEHDGSVV